MRVFPPTKDADHTCLEDKDDTNARVEAAKVCRHGWEAEGRPFDAI